MTRETYKAPVEMFEVAELLKAITSAKQHAFIELGYYHSVDEYVDYLIFIEELVPIMERFEKSVFDFSFALNAHDEEFLFRLTEGAAIIKSLAELKTVPVILLSASC